MIIFTYALPILLAALGFLAGAYECWDKKRHRPTPKGILFFLLIAAITVGQLYHGHLQEEKKNNIEFGALIAIKSINNMFEYYDKRCYEAMHADYVYYGEGKETMIRQLRAAPATIADAFKDHKPQLLKAGVDAEILEEFQGIFTTISLSIQEHPENELPRYLEYMMRRVHERLERELLKGKQARL